MSICTVQPPSRVTKRSLVIEGFKTSISLEDEFFQELKFIAKTNKTSLSHLVARIEEQKRGNLSSAIRVFVLRSAQQRMPI